MGLGHGGDDEMDGRKRWLVFFLSPFPLSTFWIWEALFTFSASCPLWAFVFLFFLSLFFLFFFPSLFHIIIVIIVVISVSLVVVLDPVSGIVSSRFFSFLLTPPVVVAVAVLSHSFLSAVIVGFHRFFLQRWVPYVLDWGFVLASLQYMMMITIATRYGATDEVSILETTKR